jgi:hypothetical protein
MQRPLIGRDIAAPSGSSVNIKSERSHVGIDAIVDRSRLRAGQSAADEG